MTITGSSRFAIAAALALLAGSARAAPPVAIHVSSAGVTVPYAAAPGAGDLVSPELDLALLAGDADAGTGADLGGQPFVNRSISRGPGAPQPAVASARATSNPELGASFDGLNFHDQRYANRGNQFSVEPPDQALCAGNGFVLESVNDVLRIYDTSGQPLTGVVDLNTFYGYAPAIDRATGRYGPSLTDPTCYFDPDTQRWFHVVLTLDRVGTTSALAGTNHLDIAVSQTADPTGAWNVYRIPVQNDGTEGTPNHGCKNGPCLGDYPHIGADANAFFITTNEFAVFGSGYYGSQVYAVSKRALAAGASSVNAVLFDTADPSVPAPGFTVWPAISAGGVYAGGNGGTEYFLSSEAVFEDSGTSNVIFVWRVTHTSAIDSDPSALALDVFAAGVNTYSEPPGRVVQRAGDVPLRDCIADTTVLEGYGTTCGRLVGSGAPRNDPISKVAASDSRMQQVYYANGKLWGALETSVDVAGATQAGIAYYVLEPRSGVVFAQGTLALEGNSLTYPSVAVTGSGRGAIAFTVLGPDHFPSAGYAGLDAKIGAGEIHVAAAGVGPQDGFTGYMPFSNRPRWGDYGAAATDGSRLWLASEYIAQTCTYAQYLEAPFGQCGGTRGSLGNWATRVSVVTP